MRWRLAGLAALVALLLAGCGGDDSESASTTGEATTTTQAQEVNIVLSTTDTDVVTVRRYNDAPRRSQDPIDHYCAWGPTPRYEVADGAGTVIAAGEFDAAEATDERGDSVAIGSTATLDPPNCQLSTTVLLPQRPDVITVTATGTTWDAFGNFEEFEDLGLDEDFGEFVNDWAAEVTLSTEEFRSSIELEVSDDDFVG